MPGRPLPVYSGVRMPPAVRTVLSSAASLFLFACELHEPLDSGDSPGAVAAVALSTYFPAPEASGGWRRTTDPAAIRKLGVDGASLTGLGQYLMSLPYEN